MRSAPLALVGAGFRRYSTYRTAALSSIVVNTAFAFIRASLLVTAIAATGEGSVGGYTAAMALAYAWWTQALIGPYNLMNFRSDVADRIKSGDVAIDMLRPIGVLQAAIYTDLGRVAMATLNRGLPMLVVATLLGHLTTPQRLATYPLFAVSFLLGAVLCFLGVLCVSFLALYVLETRGFQATYVGVQGLCSGFYLPLSWFPEWGLAIVHATPFPSMIQTPLDVVLERLPLDQSIVAVAWQAGWVLLLLAVATALMRGGQRRLEVQGG